MGQAAQSCQGNKPNTRNFAESKCPTESSAFCLSEGPVKERWATTINGSTGHHGGQGNAGIAAEVTTARGTFASIMFAVAVGRQGAQRTCRGGRAAISSLSRARSPLPGTARLFWSLYVPSALRRLSSGNHGSVFATKMASSQRFFSLIRKSQNHIASPSSGADPTLDRPGVVGRRRSAQLGRE